MSLLSCRVMRSLKYLIDAEGELTPWPFSSIRSALHCTADVNAFATHAISNLGFIYLTGRQHGLVLSLRPKVVSLRALIAAVYLLSDLPQHRIVLASLSDGWNHRFFRNPSELTLELFAELRQRETTDSNFLRRKRSVDDIAKKSIFADLMRAWVSAGAVFDHEFLDTIAHCMLRGRFALLKPQRDGHTLIIEDWGHSYGSFDKRWLSMSRGLRFEDQPDFRYALAAVDAYHEVLRSGRPLLDEIDAIVSHPQLGPRRLQYRRFILPIRAPTGEPLLLSTSLTDPNIDLRPLPLIGADRVFHSGHGR
jgi:hypothetical protein